MRSWDDGRREILENIYLLDSAFFLDRVLSSLMRGVKGVENFAIEILDLRKRYGKVEALRGLSLRVESGEIYGLIGPNGAGKTTTLKCIVGLLKPDGGQIKVCGKDLFRDRVEALRNVGYVPENPVMLQNLTVEETIRFIASLRGLKWKDIQGDLEYYLKKFKLIDKRNALMKELSRGMIQKVLVIAAMIVKPKVFVMDEPMAGMDPEAQHVFKMEVRKAVKEGATAVISSHLLDMMEKFCTRVGIINEGRLILEGRIEEVKRKAAGSESLEEVFLKVTSSGK